MNVICSSEMCPWAPCGDFPKCVHVERMGELCAKAVIDTFERCSRCKGTGVVLKTTEPADEVK